ncbi:transposase [Methanosarcina soligelidi]|uniref:transposase n=1 Tax=Methanosarcina soligelidi TaxID=1036677 RepID=UPI00064FA536|nr:transposase [Methanosarcina soligelidi]
MSFSEIDDILWESIEPYLPPQKSPIGRPRANMRKLINGILYVVMTGCTWKDVPHRYGSKSTVHRFHLYLCEHGIYQEIFNELLNKGYDLKKIDLSHCFTDTKDIRAKKGEISAMMAIRK